MTLKSVYRLQDLETIPQLQQLSERDRLAMRAVASVFPFRVNRYVVETLIDWTNIPADPMFQLTFPQSGMLPAEALDKVMWYLNHPTAPAVFESLIRDIRAQLNPNPGGQKDFNVPKLNGEFVSGIQHKYPETVLIFPAAGQSCHTFCNFCFRWTQFVGSVDEKFATRESGRFLDYLRQHSEVTDVLITGGDPMTMTATALKQYIQPLLAPELGHIQTIRIGTKSLAYFPQRYVSDRDADELLQLFETVSTSGKHLAIMAHYDHWRELQPEIAQTAIKRLRSTGAQIRTQAPMIRGINDDPIVWRRLWQEQVRLGCIPYYLFAERDTGANRYFELPLVRVWKIYQAAMRSVSGLARSVRGPVMSALPGKIVLDGVAEIRGETVFVLSMIQARNPEWCKRPFFAQYDPDATWISQLKPAFGEAAFFYEAELAELLRS